MSKSTDHGWCPIQDNHAIAVMAAVVSYSEPLPAKLLAKVIAEVEPIAFEAGLRSRHLTHGQAVQVAVQPDGSPPQIKTDPAVTGRLYNAVVESADGSLSKKISEQLQIDSNSVVYRTWNYVSWDWQFSRMSSFLESVLGVALKIVSAATIRLEYMDRFYFQGDKSGADPKFLLRPSSLLLAPHVYKSTDQWHCHTGAFIGSSKPDELLLQVTVDAVDQPGLEENAPETVRWVNIMTALERRLNARTEIPDDVSADPKGILKLLDSLHDPLKAKLAEIISDQMADRIFLKG